MTIVPLSEENVQLFSQTAEKILPEAWSFETYKKQLSNPDDISFLALCNGEAAGFISVWCVCGEAEINNIGVVEKFRRMGIAKALFDSAYNAAKAEKWYLEVRESNQSAIKFYEKLGFDVVPNSTEPRQDIIQAVTLNRPERLIAFCKGTQAAAPVDSYVAPEPWDMPGYDSKVIMAAGAFVQGSSIELSADGPLKPPYAAYFQGGLTWEHAKFGVLMSLQKLVDAKLVTLP